MQQKPAESPPRTMVLAADLLEILVCPKSKGALVYVGDAGAAPFLVCLTSRLKYRIENGVPVMLVDEAEELSADAVEQLVQSRQR